MGSVLSSVPTFLLQDTSGDATSSPDRFIPGSYPCAQEQHDAVEPPSALGEELLLEMFACTMWVNQATLTERWSNFL